MSGCGSSGGGGKNDSSGSNPEQATGIGTTGGNVASNDEKTKVLIPSGALNKTTNISVAVASTVPAGNIGLAYEFKPEGTAFNKPVNISIAYDAASLPSGVNESTLRLAALVNNEWEVIAGSTVDSNTKTVNGAVSHFSIYGVVAVTTQGTAPEAPAGIMADAGDGSVTVRWNTVSGATSYNIYRSATSWVTKGTGTKISGVVSPYPHTGRTNNTTYYYVVTAVNSNGESSEVGNSGDSIFN